MASEVTPSIRPGNRDTTEVYDDGRLLHFPGPNPGTQYTACMVDTGAMKHEHRPTMWAGMWCTACLQAMAAPASPASAGTEDVP